MPDGLPEITGVKLLWLGNFYDGPISGMVQVGSTLHWAQTVDECPLDDATGCGWYRKYKIMTLTPEQALHEIVKQDSYVQHISGYRELGWRLNFTMQQPQSEWQKFYDAYPDSDQEPSGPVIGWFTR